MKSKIVVSILLAVLMLGILATPALAAKPLRVKGELDIQLLAPPETGTATYTLVAGQERLEKLTVVLKGGKPNTTYYVRINYSSPFSKVAELHTDKNGRGRFSSRISISLAIPGAYFISLLRGSMSLGDLAYESDTINFN